MPDPLSLLPLSVSLPVDVDLGFRLEEEVCVEDILGRGSLKTLIPEVLFLLTGLLS